MILILSIIPEYLRSIPQNILLFMYEKGMVSEIKEYVRGENKMGDRD